MNYKYGMAWLAVGTVTNELYNTSNKTEMQTYAMYGLSAVNLYFLYRTFKG